jgi:hypothetical protein
MMLDEALEELSESFVAWLLFAVPLIVLLLAIYGLALWWEKRK